MSKPGADLPIDVLERGGLPGSSVQATYSALRIVQRSDYECQPVGLGDRVAPLKGAAEGIVQEAARR
jgi:hypothetical protein